MICEPWASLSPQRPLGALASAALDKPGGIDRPIGCALSLAAAAGSASCEYSNGRSVTTLSSDADRCCAQTRCTSSG